MTVYKGSKGDKKREGVGLCAPQGRKKTIVIVTGPYSSGLDESWIITVTIKKERRCIKSRK
jgi:hypothetical protein